MKKIFLLACAFSFFVFEVSSQNIIGGYSIPIEKTPWTVSCQNTAFNPPEPFFCGAIIAPNWILTSARHVYILAQSGYPYNLRIVAGSTDLNNLGVGTQIRTVDNIIYHPNYVYNTVDPEDIALLHLSQSLVYSNKVCPIEFANSCNISPSDIQLQTPISISGWGEASISSSTINYNPLLQEANLEIYDNAQTVTDYQNAGFSSVTNLTNFLSIFKPNSSPNITAWYGDKGAPAVVNNYNGNPILIGQVTGINSYAPQTYNLPTVLQSIQYTSDFVETNSSIGHDGFASLYMRDKPWDLGDEPSNAFPAKVQEFWASEDIWVRKQDDNIEIHQNPEFYLPSTNNYDYVYVRVRNKGCQATTGNEQLKVYWAKGATALNWSSYWDGSMSVVNGSGNTVPLGNLIGTITIPVIQPGHAQVLKFPWKPQNPNAYVGLGTNPLFNGEEPWHFCLLARIESNDDPMNNEGIYLTENIAKNNNIILKNVSVVNINPVDRPNQENEQKFGAAVMVGDVSGNGGTYDLQFSNSKSYAENPITNEAEVKVILDDPLWEK